MAQNPTFGTPHKGRKKNIMNPSSASKSIPKSDHSISAGKGDPGSGHTSKNRSAYDDPELKSYGR